MFRLPTCQMRAVSALCVASLQVGVWVATAIQPAVAQTLPSIEPLPGQTLPPFPETGGNPEAVSPQFSRYYLDTGDVLNISVQRSPRNRYRLERGDIISIYVQRFPDLNVPSAPINPEGNVVVPLVGTVSVEGLTLEQAQAKIRSALNRYIVDPVVTVLVTQQRPDLSFQVGVNPEGTVTVPFLGTVSVEGLTLEEAEEKIRLGLKEYFFDPLVLIALGQTRPVQVTITGEVFKPGIYGLGNPRIADAILTAGGSTTMADLREVQVRRKLVDGSVISQPIDLYNSLQSGGGFPDLRLQDGDSIVIPRREVASDDGYDRSLVARSTLAQPQIRVRVLSYAAGGIATVALPNGSNFVDALTSISLNTDNANLRNIALVRFDPERGKAITRKLDGRKALTGDASQNVPLQDNDVIVVGRSLIARISNAITTVTRPFFDFRSFLRFFELFGGNENTDNND